MSLWAAMPGEFLPEAPGRLSWRRWDDGARASLTREEGLALAACEHFATRDQHVARLRQHGMDAHRAAALLDRFVIDGLLVEPRWFFDYRDGARSAPVGAGVDPWLVVRAYERPEGLRRLLSSWANARRDGARPRRLLVVDDTRSPERARATLDEVRAHVAASGDAVHYLGPEQRAAAIDALCARDDRAALAELLDPECPSAITGSRTWNWAILRGAGGCLSILDDDTSFPLRLPTGAARSLDLIDHSEAEIEFFDDDGYARAAVVPGDPYEALGQWLRGEAGELIARDGWRQETLVDRSPRDLLGMVAGARVIGVVPGLYGGLALNTSAYAITGEASSLRSLWREPFHHGRLQADRVWHAYRHPRLTVHAVYTPLLLDDAGLLPFAGTWGRVDDTYFLMLTRAIAGPVLFAHVPAMLGHLDLRPRERAEALRQPLPVDRNAFLAHLFGEAGAALRGEDRERRLRAIGALCGALACARDYELAAEIARFRHTMLLRWVEHAQRQLDTHPRAPAAWREAVGEATRVTRAQAATERIAGDELARYRRALMQVESGARVWPEAWRKACEDPERITRACLAVTP